MNRDYVNEHLTSTYKRLETSGYVYQGIRKKFKCADGFEVSIQASDGHYCTPRENDRDFYSHVELGYPSETVEEWLEWAEVPETPTNTVYGWVPVDVVNKVIEEHGGPEVL
jgi:hypothetical protein